MKTRFRDDSRSPTIIRKLILTAANAMLAVGCTTTTTDGSLTGAGVFYEQRGASTTAIDGEQLSKVIGKVNDLAVEVGSHATGIGFVTDAVKAIKGEADEVRTVANGAATKASSAETDSKYARQETEQVRQLADKLAADLGVTKVELSEAQKTVGQLDISVQEKLKTVNADQIRALDRVKDDQGKFDAKLESILKDHKFTDAEITSFRDKTKEMTPNEIIAILLSAVGAAGAGGIMGKTGRSRAQPQIDKMNETIQELKHTTLKKGTT